MAGAWDRISMFWGERKIVEETYLHVNLLSPNGARAFLNRPQSASRWAETLEFWAEQKNGKDNNFQLVSHWVFLHVQIYNQSEITIFV